MKDSIVNSEDSRILNPCYKAKGTTITEYHDSYKLKLYLVFIFFISCLVNTLLEIFREVLIIKKQTPSSIYFIKLFLTFPLTFFVMICIQKALNNYDISKIYKFVTVLYIIYFFILGILMLPYENRIQKGNVWVLDHICDNKLEARGMKFVVSILYIFSEWIYTLLYVLSELYGSFMVSYLFFTFANSVCTKSEMEDVLPYLSTTTAMSMILSAGIYVFFDFVKRRISYKASMEITIISFICISFLTMVLYFLILSLNKKVAKGTFETFDNHNIDKPNTDSLWDILESRLLRNLAWISIMYSFNSGILEASFKNSLSDGSKQLERPIDQYSSVFINTGLVIISLAILFINFGFYRKLKGVGFLFSSLTSPIVSFVSISIISLLSFYNFPTKTRRGMFFNNLLVDKPKYINCENWIVTISGCFIKVTKFINFDMAKECISMRISKRYRGKYKSVYDGVCIKLGKSISSLYGAFFTMFGIADIRQISPITFVVCTLTNYIWIRSVLYLNKKYKESLAYNREIDVDIDKRE
ncbi:ADP,ATP carrier protein 2 [Nosema granulosis]|uniref:ADP,ATP carrier protein n=1 Tax=Nosema granulosis TaxID=83296 RepID=A0A9P6H3Z0_9MICR|nr:ADP,ATP carrier protein 2 [Nosema granulosis]